MVTWSEEELKKINKGKNHSKANRGKQLEELIQQANEHYRHQNISCVQKVPTPVKVLNIRKGRITNGFYEKKSTVDYVGTYKGYPICFDAKQTSVETRFDLSNIHDHQYKYMKEWQDNGGISFLVVMFSKLDEIYYLQFEDLEYWTEEADRKSIPYDDFEHEIESNGLILADYLSKLEEVEEIE